MKRLFFYFTLLPLIFSCKKSTKEGKIDTKKDSTAYQAVRPFNIVDSIGNDHKNADSSITIYQSENLRLYYLIFPKLEVKFYLDQYKNNIHTIVPVNDLNTLFNRAAGRPGPDEVSLKTIKLDLKNEGLLLTYSTSGWTTGERGGTSWSYEKIQVYDPKSKKKILDLFTNFDNQYGYYSKDETDPFVTDTGQCHSTYTYDFLLGKIIVKKEENGSSCLGSTLDSEGTYIFRNGIFEKVK